MTQVNTGVPSERHRMGFRVWWRWRSHNPGGRPGIDQELRDLVRRMCKGKSALGRAADSRRAAQARL